MNLAETTQTIGHRHLFIAVALMLLAFALRVYAINDFPPGLTHDEIAHLDVANQIRSGDWPNAAPVHHKTFGPGLEDTVVCSESHGPERSKRLPTKFVIGLADQ